MAFENVFGNVNYGMIPNARHAESNMLMQAIGRGIANYEQGQERDLKRRQLEAQANKLDLQQKTEEALVDLANGIPLTPEKRGYIEAFSILKGSQSYVDPLTNQFITKPALMERAGLQGATRGPQASYSPIGGRADLGPPLTQDMAQEEYMEPVPPIPAGAIEGDTYPERSATEPMKVDKFQEFKAGGKYGNTGLLKELDVNSAIFKEIAKEERTIQNKLRESKRPLFSPKDGFVPSEADIKSMTDLVVSKTMLNGLIDDYKSAVNKYGVSVKGTEGAMAIDRAAGKIRMQVKNLEQLGALQEPDIRAMNEMLGSAVLSIGDVANPISGYTQIKRGDEIANKSMDEFKTYVNKTIDAQAETRGFVLKDSEKPKKDEPSRVPVKNKIDKAAIRAELERRRGK